MTIRIALWVVSIFLFSIALVAGLWAVSKDIRETPGSFLRQYPPHPVVESKKIRLSDEHYYFAGVTSDKVYLANTLRPMEILAINTNMSDTSVVQLDLGITERLRFFRITVKVDSPYFYFMDGAIPYIYRGKIADWKARPFMEDSSYFLDAVPISSRSFALCALSAATHEKALGKLVVNKHVKLNHDVLERQFDGVFDVDGSLSYGKELNRLVYVYYYRNQFMVMDTNVNLVYRGNTIDTFAIAQVKTAKVSAEKATRLSAPPIVTNKSHAVYKQWLFVHSLLPAKNEYMYSFDKASVIDVYDLNSGVYRFSFYVFNEDGEKMKSLIVSNGKLYALFKRSLRRFDLVKTSFD